MKIFRLLCACALVSFGTAVQAACDAKPAAIRLAISPLAAPASIPVSPSVLADPALGTAHDSRHTFGGATQVQGLYSSSGRVSTSIDYAISGNSKGRCVQLSAVSVNFTPDAPLIRYANDISDACRIQVVRDHEMAHHNNFVWGLAMASEQFRRSVGESAIFEGVELAPGAQTLSREEESLALSAPTDGLASYFNELLSYYRRLADSRLDNAARMFEEQLFCRESLSPRQAAELERRLAVARATPEPPPPALPSRPPGRLNRIARLQPSAPSPQAARRPDEAPAASGANGPSGASAVPSTTWNPAR